MEDFIWLKNMNIALYQPDIPQNTGTIMRLSACLNVHLDIIEPCGFVFNDKYLKRSAMDYIEHLNWTRHDSWETFFQESIKNNKRVILVTTKTNNSFYDFQFEESDILLMGRESAGVPEEVHNTVNHKVTIPMASHCRSMNLAIATAMVTTEALRQTRILL